MRGTIKQFKDTLEQMKSIYDYDDAETIMSTHNILTLSNDYLEIKTVDEKTGITIAMAKEVYHEAEI